MKQKLIKIAKLLLVVLFISYYSSITLFYHTHYFSWGQVTHSHPYLPFEDSNTSHHSHTQGECQTIDMLSSVFIISLFFAILFFQSNLVTYIYSTVRRYVLHTNNTATHLRAPPAFIC